MATEQRLIDADALIESFRIVARSGGAVIYHVSDICAAIEDEADNEFVDAVEVVRCKDCKHRHTRVNCQGRGMEFFCADGERK